MKSNNPQGKLNLQDLKQGHAALFEFFCNSLKELYWAENEMVGVLKKIKTWLLLRN